MAAWVGFRCLWNAFNIRMQASEPNKPSNKSGRITPSFHVIWNTVRSRAEIKAISPAPIIKTAKEVDVTAIGLSCFVILSV